jgi:hypothetical protein
MTTRRAPDPLQKYLLNPLDKLAFRLRVPPPAAMSTSPLTARIDLAPR